MEKHNEVKETVRKHLEALVASNARRRRVAIIGNDGYAVFFGQPGLGEVGVEVSAGRQVDRSRMTVEFAAHCEKIGFRRSRASDNFSRNIGVDTAELDTWVQWAIDTLSTFFDAESFETKICFEDHPELDAVEIHKAMENLARERSWAARTGLYMMLVKRSFLVAVDEPTVATEEPPAISSIDTLGDRPVAALFTTLEHLDRFSPTGHAATLVDGMSLFPLLLSLGVGAVRINPGASPRGELYSNEVQILVDGIKRLRH
ncbi:MAG: hypothetical protein VYA30_06205 [Myxococcota bacterium]|nr:hypothetical protein [Myxococcota bacterium]